jgi:hypothetical protein
MKPQLRRSRIMNKAAVLRRTNRYQQGKNLVKAGALRVSLAAPGVAREDQLRDGLPIANRLQTAAAFTSIISLSGALI